MKGDLVRQMRPYLLMPRGILSDQRIGLAEKVVAAALWSYAGDDNEVYPKHDGLAERTGLSRRSVVGSLESLRTAGWISWSRGRYGNHYILSPALSTPRCEDSNTSEGTPRCEAESVSENARCELGCTSEQLPDVQSTTSRCEEHDTSDVQSTTRPIRKIILTEEYTQSSSSSSGSAPSVPHEEDEESILVLKTKTGEPEDLGELVRFISSALESSTGQRVSVGTGDARRTRAKAPDWTIAEIMEGFAAHATNGKPQSVHWFPTTLADIYQRLESKPPVIPQRCAHGVIVSDGCSACERDAAERRQAEKRKRDQELQNQGICPHCMNRGRVRFKSGLDGPCGWCEFGRQEQAREDAVERRKNQLGDRFEPLRRRIEKLAEVKKPWEMTNAFIAADADRREEICDTLERDCSLATINNLLQPKESPAA